MNRDNRENIKQIITMGIAPEIWGPSAWKTIHLFCLGAPETLSATEQLYYTSFFQSLGHVLPCATCSGHYQEHLKQYPVESSVMTRDALFEWSVNIHNSANRSLGKPTMTLEEARAVWQKVIASGNTATHGDLMGNGMGMGMGASRTGWTILIVILLLGVGIGLGVGIERVFYRSKTLKK